MDSLLLKSFIPEIFFSIAILFQLLFNTIIGSKIKLNNPTLGREAHAQSVFILIVLFFLYSKLKIITPISNFVFVNDQSILFAKLLLIAISIFLTLILKNSLLLQKISFVEYFSIFLLAILSSLFLLNCENLMSFYVVMEMQALCFYILAAINRTSIFSAESGLKYFLSGSFISGIFLIAASIIYGCLGSLDLNIIGILLAFPIESPYTFINTLLFSSFLLIIFVLLFKLSCAPFHFWSPDVYDGAPLSSTIIFSILPKISILYFFIKLLLSFYIFFDNIRFVLLALGTISVFVGTFNALNQTRMKKLIIYSSISQIGFIVAVLSVSTINGFAAVYIFLFIYLMTSLLVWGIVTMLSYSKATISRFFKEPIQPLYITDLKNMRAHAFILCFLILVAFFSIGGIPPLGGFLAKVIVLAELITINHSYAFIASSLLIAISAISVYYYIRVIKISFFETNKQLPASSAYTILDRKHFNVEFSLLVFLAFLLVFLFVFSDLILLVAEYIAIASNFI